MIIVESLTENLEIHITFIFYPLPGSLKTYFYNSRIVVWL